MRKGIYLTAAAFSILFSSNLMAEEAVTKSPGIADKIIAATFKTLAKAYVATANLEKIKKTQMSHLEGMDNDKFQKRFNKIQATLSPLPASFKSKYGLKDQMTKEEVIMEIEKLDKKRISQMIEETPDSFIAFQFKKYLNDFKQDTKESDWVKKIHEFWESIIPKAEKWSIRNRMMN